MVFWPLPLIPMNPCCWSVGEVALLQILEALDADVMKEYECALAYTLTLVVQK